MVRRTKRVVFAVKPKVTESIRVVNSKPKQKRVKSQSLIMSPAKDLACSVADPWNCAACIPDGSRGTGCFSLKQETTLSTGVGGSCCSYALTCSADSINNFDFVDSASVANVPTFGGSWNAARGAAAASAAFKQFRVVSAGVKCTYTGNTQTDQGQLLICAMPPNITLFSLNAQTIAQISNQSMYFKTYSLRNGGQIVWLPDDMDDQSLFKGGSANVTTANLVEAAPWILIIVYGASANQNCLQLESIVNLEGQFQNQAFIPGGINTTSKATQPEPGWYEKTKQFLMKFEPIAPLAISIMQQSANPVIATLGTMANGLMPRTNLTSGRRRL